MTWNSSVAEHRERASSAMGLSDGGRPGCLKVRGLMGGTSALDSLGRGCGAKLAETRLESSAIAASAANARSPRILVAVNAICRFPLVTRDGKTLKSADCYAVIYLPRNWLNSGLWTPGALVPPVAPTKERGE